ncbi:MAG: hypothetical protein U0935_19490 [Pirellulales bacterium]
MFRTWRMLLAGLMWVGFLVPATVSGQEKSGPPQLEFPPSLGTLNYVERNTYQQPELGYSVRYAGANGLKADIYLYDLGRSGLGTGEAGPEVREHLVEVIRDVFLMEKRGYYRGVRVLTEETMNWATVHGRVPLLHAVLEYSQTSASRGGEEKPLVSHVLLATYQDHFFKIRFTYAEADRIEGAASLRLFLQDCGELLR